MSFFEGASVIDSIKNKIQLLSVMHELEDIEINLTNVAISIEQCAICIFKLNSHA